MDAEKSSPKKSGLRLSVGLSVTLDGGESAVEPNEEELRELNLTDFGRIPKLMLPPLPNDVLVWDIWVWKSGSEGEC